MAASDTDKLIGEIIASMARRLSRETSTSLQVITSSGILLTLLVALVGPTKGLSLDSALFVMYAAIALLLSAASGVFSLLRTREMLAWPAVVRRQFIDEERVQALDAMSAEGGETLVAA